MYSICPAATMPASGSAASPRAARSALTTAAATSLNGWARPLPRLKIPLASGWSRNQRLTATTSST